MHAIKPTKTPKSQGKKYQREAERNVKNETINHYSSDVLITLGNVTLLIVLFGAKASNENWNITNKDERERERDSLRL